MGFRKKSEPRNLMGEKDIVAAMKSKRISWIRTCLWEGPRANNP